MRLTNLGLAVVISMAACKNEKAPQPKSEKTGTGTDTSTSLYNGSQPGGNGSNADGGMNLPTDTQSTTDSDTSTNTGSGSGRFYIDDIESSRIDFTNAKLSQTVRVKSQDGSRTFKLTLTGDSSNIRISSNDSEAVTASFMSPTETGSGTISVVAKDTTNDTEETMSLPWSANGASGSGSGGLGSYAGSGGSSGNSQAMAFGFQLLSQVLGLGGGPQALFGTNQGTYGGGQYNQNVGAWGQQQQNGQQGCTDPYGNYSDPYSQNGNCNTNQIGNQYGNQNQYGNGNGNGNVDQYGNPINNGTNQYGTNQYGTNQYGTGTCAIGRCSQCTQTECTSVGCRYTGGYCREPSGSTYGTGTCSRTACQSCTTQATCQQQQCTWNPSLYTCSTY